MNDDSTIGITLTKDEAKLLVILTEYVGGTPDKSLRRASDSLRTKLIDILNTSNYRRFDIYDKLGIKMEPNDYYLIDMNYYAPDINIYFKDGSNL